MEASVVLEYKKFAIFLNCESSCFRFHKMMFKSLMVGMGVDQVDQATLAHIQGF